MLDFKRLNVFILDDCSLSKNDHRIFSKQEDMQKLVRPFGAPTSELADHISTVFY